MATSEGTMSAAVSTDALSAARSADFLPQTISFITNPPDTQSRSIVTKDASQLKRPLLELEFV
jgi:hypothetical protein